MPDEQKLDLDSSAIEIRKLSQTYRLYGSAASMAADALGLYRLRFWKKKEFQSHAALKNVSLKIGKGERVGLIGRNGAGKTTLLKLITQNYEPTSGEVIVHGRIQSLMDQGVGFHPEFTARENIRSALIYNGILGKDVETYEQEILDFVELGKYVDQPIKTYSLGMKARLGFATATAIKPDIIIIDEVLGAGDAYFASKSAARMKRLTGEGVTLLLVSHSNAQILQFCDRAIWIEKGEIVADGPALEVVKAYDKFILELENRRLAHENSKDNPDQILPSLQKVEINSISRWQGSGELLIQSVRLLDEQSNVTSVVKTNDHVKFEMIVKAVKGGTYPCFAHISAYSMDGRAVCKFTSEQHDLVLAEGDVMAFVLDVQRLLLGNGEYVFSPSLYSKLDFDDLQSAKFYDLLDRSFAFKVYSKFEEDISLFVQPAQWSISPRG